MSFTSAGFARIHSAHLISERPATQNRFLVIFFCLKRQFCVDTSRKLLHARSSVNRSRIYVCVNLYTFDEAIRHKSCGELQEEEEKVKRVLEKKTDGDQPVPLTPSRIVS